MELDFITSAEGHTYTAKVSNAPQSNGEEQFLYLTLTITNGEIIVHTQDEQGNKAGQPKILVLSTKFKGSVIGSNNQFTMYALSKQSKLSKLPKPSYFIRQFDNGELKISFVAKEGEYEGFLERIDVY